MKLDINTLSEKQLCSYTGMVQIVAINEVIGEVIVNIPSNRYIRRDGDLITLCDTLSLGKYSRMLYNDRHINDLRLLGTTLSNAIKNYEEVLL